MKDIDQSAVLDLLARNRAWASSVRAEDPKFFRNLSQQQAPQFLWIKKWRTNMVLLFVWSIIVNIGMWLERYVIVVTSLTRDFLPSSWDTYSGTIWDWMAYIGSMGLFLTMLCLFVKFLPMISIFELRHQQHQVDHGEIA